MKNLFLCSVFLLIGSGAIYFAKKEYNTSKELVKTGIETKAEVVDILEVDDDDGGGSTYKSVFEYTDQSNKLIRAKNNYSSNPPAQEMGEILEIVYIPNTKTLRVNSFWGLYFSPIMLFLVGFIFGGIGLFQLRPSLFVEEGDYIM